MGETGTGRRRIVLGRERVQMAQSTARFSTVYNRGKFLLCCNQKRTLGEDPSSIGGKSTDYRRAKSYPKLCDHRLAKRKNHLSRRGARYRWRKKTKGRKRHIVVDTMGNLLAVVVHAANIHDTKAGIRPARKAFEKYPSIQRFCADAGYRKTFEQNISQELGLGVDISARIKPG